VKRAPAAVALCALAGAARAETDRAALGARAGRAGEVALVGSTGMVLVLPHVTAAGRVALGAGTGLELGYRNIAVFGQEGRARFGWGAPVSSRVDLGIALRTSMSTLAPADGGLFGIQFSNLPLANDWEIGSDAVVTIHRPGQAHVTASLGPTFTLGGIRYVDFKESAGFQFDPALRAMSGSVQGEWELTESLHLVLRLDAMVLLGIEKDDACVEAHQSDCSQIAPLGFLPTGSVGIAWLL
jgi:hypothetical protein